MPVTRDLAFILKAAEAAAVAGDFSAAAAELRDALEVQEATLGPTHPDLADTLNNLGVASERAKRLDDAERYYRRALAVATAAYPADHPFVATSRANLREFCEANGRPLEQRSPAPAAPPPPAAPPKPEQAPPKPRQASPTPPPALSKPEPAPRKTTAPPAPPPVATPPPARPGSLGPVAIGAAILIVVIAVLALLLGGGSQSTPPDPAKTAAPPGPAAPPPAAPDRASAPPAGGRSATAPAAGLPSLVSARLCRRLVTDEGEWNCERATSPVAPGSLTFLTRVRSDRNITVQHRWYRGQELVRSAPLKVAANPSEGYRTYSRYLVTAGAAEWRVELRASDGTLLHEEKFVVR